MGVNYKGRVVVMSLGFFGLFMAFNTAQALTTSLNGQLGNVCLAVLYVTFTLACVVAPPLVYKLGPRLSMIIGALPYVGMILSNLAPSYSLSVPMNFLVGLGAPLLWTGEGVFVGQCALAHARESNVLRETATSQFNALFFSLFQSNGVVGLVTSSIILLFVDGSKATHVLFIVMGVFACTGIVIFTFVKQVEDEPVKSVNHNSETAPIVVTEVIRVDVLKDTSIPNSSSSITPAEMKRADLWQTLQLAWEERKMMLLIPLIFYNGLSLGFILGAYSANVATKGLGVSYTGFVIATFYGADAIFTGIYGRFINFLYGRKGLVVIATIAHTVFYVFFLLWDIPDNFTHNDNDDTQLHDVTGTQYGMIFLGSIVFGMGDAVWSSQIPAILQAYFDKAHSRNATDGEAAMANLKMWQSLGFAVQFILGVVLADYFSSRIVILLAFQIIGTILAFWIDRYVPGGQLDPKYEETKLPLIIEPGPPEEEAQTSSEG